jgi:hypothetical protein
MTEAGHVATQAAVTAAALDGGRAIDAWSLVLALAAVGGMLWTTESRAATSTVCFGACIFAGLAQRYYAARVAFDATLFKRWSQTIESPAGSDSCLELLEATDSALANLGLRINRDEPTRDLATRSRGALRLLGRQIMYLVAQFATLLVALML